MDSWGFFCDSRSSYISAEIRDYMTTPQILNQNISRSYTRRVYLFCLYLVTALRKIFAQNCNGN